MQAAVICFKGIQKSDTMANVKINFQVAAPGGFCVDAVCETALPLRSTNYTIETDLGHAARAALLAAGDASANSRPMLVLGGQHWLSP